ncbi:hypothetical protein like AT5G16940 [Hibiscus trionum]|uniref:CENP-V/GFA domain-containing protein n=1 Tax=Hibiscus trionum TaxID=183268 RepID=A0A9W7MNP6_HIBTR|nr:hypothetical protein like AT5G16940 [Hibiscus trionum]
MQLFRLLDERKYPLRCTARKVCGITSFYTPRSNPDGIAVTLKCLDPGTLSHVEIRHADGKNWEKFFEESDIASESKIRPTQ